MKNDMIPKVTVRKHPYYSGHYTICIAGKYQISWSKGRFDDCPRLEPQLAVDFSTKRKALEEAAHLRKNMIACNQVQP